ncbi:MAG TPA: hypothetical protein VK034_06845, partial [Enhygromyxa sp.]|nr:hypothetical protein [Enhygromyxa sp.]
AGCVTEAAPEVEVGEDGQAVLAGIPPAEDTTLAGGTPAEDAVDVSGQYLQSLDPDRPKAMVLITDGLANCSDSAADNPSLFEVYDTKLPQTVADLWQQAQIPVYVVGIDIDTNMTPASPDGIPDSAIPWCKLDQVGEVGGKPAQLQDTFSCDEAETDQQDFYSVSNDNELLGALETVFADVRSCQATLDPVPAFPGLLEIEIDGDAVPKVDNCANQDGWVYSHPNGPFDAIEFCGSWCEQLADAGQTDALYFCEP